VTATRPTHKALESLSVRRQRSLRNEAATSLHQTTLGRGQQTLSEKQLDSIILLFHCKPLATSKLPLALIYTVQNLHVHGQGQFPSDDPGVTNNTFGSMHFSPKSCAQGNSRVCHGEFLFYTAGGGFIWHECVQSTTFRGLGKLKLSRDQSHTYNKTGQSVFLRLQIVSTALGLKQEWNHTQ
jgi:hypothetical protein